MGSPSSCSIPWHRGVTCPCCFKSIHHLILCHAVRITRGGSDWDSQILCQRPLECLPFFLCARTRHWHDFGPWKHTITFIACGLGGFRHFVPWQDAQNEFWTEELLLGTEQRRYVCAHTPLHSQAPTLPSCYTIPFAFCWSVPRWVTTYQQDIVRITCVWSHSGVTKYHIRDKLNSGLLLGGGRKVQELHRAVEC